MRSSALVLLAVPAVLHAGCVGDEPTGGSTPQPDASVPSSTDSGGNTPETDASQGNDSSSDAGVDAGPSITGDFTSAYSLGATTVARAVATDANGDVVIVGTIEGTVTINGLSYQSEGRDVLVVRLAPNNGVKWAKRFGGAQTEDGNAVAIDANGDVYIAGDYNGGGAASVAATFGTKTLTSAHAGYNSFVAKLDGTNGNPLWASSYDVAGSLHICRSLAAGPTSVAVGCQVSGTVSYTKTDDQIATRTAGSQDAWIAELDPASGKVARGLLMTGAGVGELAYDKTNKLYAWGTVKATVTGDTPVINVTKTGTADAFIVALAAPASAGADRTLGWSKAYGSSGATTNPGGLAVAPDGSVYVSGLFGGTRDFGKGQMTAAGTLDAFVLHLDSTNNGATLAQTQIGANGTAISPAGIAVDDIGHPIVSHYYRNTGFTLGGVVLPNTDVQEDASSFVTKLSPDLSKIEYVKLTQGKSNGVSGARHQAIATNGATGQSVVAGFLGGTADLGNGQDTTITPGGLYVIRRAR